MDNRQGSQQAPPPSLDQVLAWLAELETTAEGSTLLKEGRALRDQVIKDFGEDRAEAVANRLIGLAEEGLIAYIDPAATVDQISAADRLGLAADFRIRTAGHDRLRDAAAPEAKVVQIVHATTAQVAAGNIINKFNSFDEFLDALAVKIDDVKDVDEEAKEEARGILDKLRSAGGTVTTGALGSAGGALLGSLIKQFTGLP